MSREKSRTARSTRNTRSVICVYCHGVIDLSELSLTEQAEVLSSDRPMHKVNNDADVPGKMSVHLSHAERDVVITWE